VNDTLGEFLRAKASEFGDRPALLSRPRYRTDVWSYRRLLDESGRVACWLQARGVVSGQRVVLWAPNSPWWVAAFFGALRCGAIVVPLDMRSGPAFQAQVFGQTEPALALVAGPIDAPPTAASGAATVPFVHLDDMVASLPPVGCSPAPVGPLAGDSIAEIMFTSGTTGDPKGVVLTHGNILANVDGVARVFPANPEHRLLSLLPLSHMFEQTVGLLVPLTYGASVFYPLSRQPAVIFRDLARQKITTLVAVPQMLHLFMAAIEREVDRSGQRARWERAQRVAACLPLHARRFLFRGVHRRLGGALTLLISGGAALDPALARRWELLGIPVLQGYGTTEAAPCIATTNVKHRKPGSVGRAVPGVELRVAADGEVLVRGRNITPGYWRNDEATRRAFVDGWYATGDLGRLDHGGYLTLLGRKKNLIVLDDGQNVYPEDVEAALKRAGAADAVVLGRRSVRGIQVHAVLLLAEGAPPPDVIISAANARLAPHQHVRGYTVWAGDDFPRTHTLKVRRDAVLAAVAEEDAACALRPYDMRPQGAEPETGAPPLRHLIAGLTRLPIGDIGGDLALSDAGLDSLGRVELLSAIETELGVYVDEATIGPQTTVAELERIVGEREGGVSGRPHFPSWPRAWLARAARAALRPVISALVGAVAPAHVAGLAHLRCVRPPVIFVANHTSHLDTPTLLRALPRAWAEHVAVAAAADYFFAGRVLGALAGLLLNAFPFSRAGAIGPTLEHCADLLDGGWSLLLYPEGTRTRTGQIGPFREGVGLLTVEMGVPVVPMRVDGLYDVLPKGRILPHRGPVTVWIGRPLQVQPGTTYDRAAAQIEAAVRALGRTRRSEVRRERR
jgi:long-chain acyl-CoA synthetase